MIYTHLRRPPIILSVAMIILFTTFIVGCNNNSTKTNNTVTLESGEQIIYEKDTRITTRDGTTLSANIFRPVEAGNYPVIMAMTPYNKDLLPYEHDPEDGDINVSEYAAFELPDPAFWVPNDYVVIAIDARGMNLSEGDLEFFSNHEAEDFYDAIEWAAAQSWSNGNVGLNGVSYMAINQWRVAQMQPPALKAIMPWEGFTDFYRDAVYHGGILDDSFLPPWWEYRILENKNPNAQDQRLPELIKNNPLYNEVYEAMTPNQLESIDIPAYVVASWPDHGLHTRGTILGFEKISSEHKWLEIHGRKKLEWYYSEAAQERQLQFFDYFLAGKNNGMLDNPSVTYEARSSYYEGETKTASEWPILDAEMQTLYLQASSNEMVATPTSNTEISSYLADNSIEPENVDASNQVTFNYTFTEDTEITGGMNLVLWVSLDGADDTDFFVGVQKFNATGEYINFLGNDTEDGQVANGWLRASHRALDPAKSTPTRPYHLHTSEEKITTTDIFPVEIEILPSSTSFIAGDILSLVIQGIEIEESGLVEHESISNGQVSIHTGEQYPSRLVYSTIN